MRRIAVFIAALGIVMVMGAVFVAIDGFATDDRKEAFSGAVDQMADGQDGQPGRRSALGGLAKAAKSLDAGVFFSAPVELADALPAPPEGWERRAYDGSVALAVTGEELIGFNWTKSQDMLARFAEAAEGKGGAAAVYAWEDRLIAIRLGAELDDFRRVANGSEAEVTALLSAPPLPAEATVLGTMDGIEIIEGEAYSEGAPPETYRRFTFSLGTIVGGEVITTAADADLVAVLSGLNVALIEAALPRPTQNYAPGSGFVYLAGDTPPTEVILSTPESLAETMLERDDLDPAEREALTLVAGGQANDWHQLSRINDGDYPVTERMVEVLGPEPAALMAERLAKGL